MRPSTLPPPRLTVDTIRKLTLTHPIPLPPSPSPSPLPATPCHLDHLTTLLTTNCTTLHHLKQIHTQIYLHSYHQHSYILTKLIRTLTHLRIPTRLYSYSVFRQVYHPNNFLWTAILRGFILDGDFSTSLLLYRSMRRTNVIPNSFTLCAVLKGCKVAQEFVFGTVLHGEMVKLGMLELEFFVHAGNMLIDFYMSFRVFGSAQKVFDEMPVRDRFSWTSLIVAYAKGGDVERARELFDEFDGEKDVVIWSVMITGYAQNAQPKECLELFEVMNDSGVESDEFALASVISACAQMGTGKYARRIQKIAEMLGCGAERNVVIGSALVDMYSKCGRVDDAFEVFMLMREKNVYTYSSMIMGFAVNGCANAAMKLFYDMEKTDIRPNRVKFVGVLTACSHAGMVEEGRRLFRSMKDRYGVVPNADHYTCMVDILGRSGKLEEALAIANSLPSHPHGGVWGSLLSACNIHSNPDIAEIAAENLFVLEPDGIGNYLLLFNILASAEKWDRASRVQQLMKEKGLKKYPARSWVEGKKGSVHEFFAGGLTHPRHNEIKHVLEDLLFKLNLHGYQPNLSSVSYDISDDDKREILMGHSEKLALAFELLTTESDHTIRIMKNLRICEDCHVFMCGVSKITEREIIIRDNIRFHHFNDGVCSCGNFW